MFTFKENQKVYNFTLLNKVEKDIWSCECVCGNTLEVHEQDLLSGNKQSCGCRNIYIRKYQPFLKYSLNKDHLFLDIYPGKVFDNFTVIEQTDKEHLWLCKCNYCDKTIIIDDIYLLNNLESNCDCQNIETEES